MDITVLRQLHLLKISESSLNATFFVSIPIYLVLYGVVYCCIINPEVGYEALLR